MAKGTQSTGAVPGCACARGELTKENASMTTSGTKLSTVPLDWKEVYYTNCRKQL